jgi:hypothetical protein
MDSTHTTVSASTTAEVLAYYSMGGYLLLTDADRAEYIAQITQQKAFPALVDAIGTEIATNPDAFVQTDSAVQTALNAFFTSLTGIKAGVKKGEARPDGILINPTATQSGLTVLQTPPSSAYLSNAYRRRSHAFVTRVSETLGGTTSADPAAVTDFEIPPTSGVNGGVAGTLIDIFNAYYGNQPTEYAPIDTDPFSVPLVGTNDATNYQVLVVGPGGQNLGAVSSLTTAQETARVQVSVGGFAEDALIPFLSNFALGSGILPDTTRLPSSTVAEFKANLAEDLAADFVSLIGSTPQLQQEILAGDYRSAMGDLYTLGVNGSTFSGLYMDAITKATSVLVANGFNPGPMSTALEKFNIIMNAAGGVLQVFDTGVYGAQIAGSDAVDTWTVATSPQKVTLTPAATTLNGLGNVGLTAALPGADVTGYSYQWTVTPAVAGNSLVGDLTEVGGAGRAGQTSYCSSSPNATYINTASEVANLTQPTTDVVTVTAFSSGNCTATNQVGKPVTATVTTDPTAQPVISPADATIAPGGTVALAVTVANVTNTTGYSYQWTVTPNAPSTAVSGNLTGLGAATGSSPLTYCSASTNATYTSTITTALTSPVSDVVSVKAYTSAGCTPANQVGSATASSITTSSVILGITPSNTVINPGDAGPTLTAKLPSAINTTGYSYMWTLTPGAGAALGGTLTDTGGSGGTGLTSYCSPSNQAAYVSTAPSTLTDQITDTITATAYSSSGCKPVNQVAATAIATVSTQPKSTSLVNGDFSKGLTGWTAYTSETSGSLSQYVFINTSCYYGTEDDYPAQEGNPFVEMEAVGTKGDPYGGFYDYIQQTFTVPANATTLSLRAWNNLDPVYAVISIIDSAGNITVLDTFTPPSIQALSNPNNPYSVVATGNTAVTKVYSISGYAGQTITLRLEADGYPTGENGFYTNFDDVTVQ